MTEPSTSTAPSNTTTAARSPAQRQHRSSRLQRQVEPAVIRVPAGRRPRTVELADEHRRFRRRELDSRKFAVVLESRRAVAGGVGLRDPELHAVQLAPDRRSPPRRADAVAGGHQVELAGLDDLVRAQAGAVPELSRQQPRHRLQAGVGMGPDAGTGRAGDGGGAHVVDEAPRPHRCAAPGEGAPAGRGGRRPRSPGSA